MDRRRLFDDYLASVGPNEVGQLRPSDGETIVSLTSLIRAAARRARARIETWVVDEVLYFRMTG
jgi:hypothetical protein